MGSGSIFARNRSNGEKQDHKAVNKEAKQQGTDDLHMIYAMKDGKSEPDTVIQLHLHLRLNLRLRLHLRLQQPPRAPSSHDEAAMAMA
ncbi:uncharacterized protein PG998_008020 [Apiospora kogelbergensis]|uniref:uncharacterized protein n=1 Tax=Apiospora kogelbergensis TaxID=1337665 RepID=UPI00312D9591